MIDSSTSLLYLPNEMVEGDQVGPRSAFTGMLEEGKLKRYEAFSFLVLAKAIGASEALERIIEHVNRYQPTMLLWQHVGRFPVTPSYLRRLRAASPATHFLYHEGDVYGRWIKRLPAPAKALMAAADTVALVGSGEFEALAKSVGARRVLYTPHSVDVVRFGKPWVPTMQRQFDVLMIGNRVTSRLPWGRMPGAASREKLVRELGRIFGDRFAVYGNGWNGFTGNRGPLPFNDQEAAQRQAWITVSWDHFDTVERYFSDRVPISLASGVPHVTNYQPGYEDVFGMSPPLLWAKSVGEMIRAIRSLLDRGPNELNALGEAAQLYGLRRFSARAVYERLIVEALRR